MYVLVASDGVLRNLRRGPTANLEQAKNRSEETAQKHICRHPSHCLHFNGSNSNKQYNWLPIVLLLFKQTMTSGTRDSMKYIRRGEEGVRASDPEPSENQATPGGVLPSNNLINNSKDQVQGKRVFKVDAETESD